MPPVLSSSSSSSLRLLLLDVGSTQSRLHAAPNLRVQQSAQEHHGCAHPVPGGEGVLEVEDGEDEAEELSEGDHESDRQRGALCGQDEHATDAHVLCDDVDQQVDPHYWHSQPSLGNNYRSALTEVDAVVVDVAGEEQEARQR